MAEEDLVTGSYFHVGGQLFFEGYWDSMKIQPNEYSTIQIKNSQIYEFFFINYYILL